MLLFLAYTNNRGKWELSLFFSFPNFIEQNTHNREVQNFI